jgi:hypothetical protein
MKNELIEIASDLAEVGLLGVIYKVSKVASSVPDLLFAAKVRCFLNEL